MAEIKIPELGESITEATILKWVKKPGDSVGIGDILLELETDKVNLEVGAEKSGTLSEILAGEGADVQIGQVVGHIDAGDGGGGGSAPAAEQKTDTAEPAPKEDAEPESDSDDEPETKPKTGEAPKKETKQESKPKTSSLPQPARQAAEHSAPVKKEEPGTVPPKASKPQQPAQSKHPKSTLPPSPPKSGGVGDAREETIKLSRRRRTIAANLIHAQSNAAMLTTFNEVDMSAVMDMRRRHQGRFVEAHGIKLGFTSFFVKAVVSALKEYPQVNAELADESTLLMKYHYDIGIAVGSEEGLVVPVLRDADAMSFAEIEQEVKNYADKARAGELALEDLRGGTFTITNGGIFGSMLSTPILNTPQVGILGLHNIVERPVVVDGEIVVRPIMYTALTYDHRIVDGREAVSFLVHVKKLIEDPEKLLLGG